MKYFNNLSIKLKLTISCVAIVILSVIIFAIIVLSRSASVVTRLAEKNVNQVTDSAAQHIAMLIDDINASLLSFHTKESVQTILSGTGTDDTVSEVEALENALLEMDIFQSRILKSELYVLNRDDFPEINNNRFVFSDKQFKNDSWYNSMLDAGNTTKWLIRDNVSDNQSFIVASKLIHDVYTKKTVAILKTNIDIHSFTDYLDNITLADTGKIFLCSKNHIVNRTDSSIGEKLKNNPIIFNDMLTSSTAQTRIISLDKVDWIVKSLPLGNTGMFLLSAVKINEFSTAQGSITSAIFVTAIVLIFLSLALVLFISSLITKPLHSLTNRMNNYNIENNNGIKSVSNDEIGILFDSFNAMDEQIRTLIENVNRETEIRKIAELKALQAQITPHFLYNTLNSISALSKSYGAQKIEKMTVALSRFFMNSLNNGAEMISIANELEQVMSYVYIQKIRYGDKFDVLVDADEEIKKYLICKLTLQPLVENCIYHAFRDIDYTGIINIKIIKENDYIVITVSDNGIGNITVNFKKMNEYVNKSFDLDEPIEKYGIHNISQRIKLYFGNDCGMYYYPNEGEGLTVKITIKAIKPKTNPQNGGRI